MIDTENNNAIVEEKTEREVYRPNLEKLVAFAESQDDDETLIPLFLAVLEICFQS